MLILPHFRICHLITMGANMANTGMIFYIIFQCHIFTKRKNMKNAILFFSLMILVTPALNAQMTLTHTFPKQIFTQSQIVDLSLSGKKIMTLTDANSPGQADTIYFYNLDYSFWKAIPCPAIPGYVGYFNLFHELGRAIGVFYPSETLFNTDPLLEIAVFYRQGLTGKFLIINETGAIVDSILNATSIYCSSFRVYKVDTLGIGFQAVVPTLNGIEVYNLPGTLPCNVCGNDLGLAENKINDIPTSVMPNPSSNEVKITFTLPGGVKQGELNLYNTNGQLLKSYKVDDRFGYILIDNSQLPPGMYYYNIVANGMASLSQKMVLVK